MLNLPIKILRTIQIETDEATVTFGNIAALVAAWDADKDVTSRHLVVIVNAASPDAIANRALRLQFNGDGGANYHDQVVYGIAAAPGAGQASGNDLWGSVFPGTTYANSFGGGIFLLPHAFNTVNHKTLIALAGAVEDIIVATAGRWASVAAITSMVLTPTAGNLATGSTFHLGVIDERYLVEEILLAADGTPTFDNIPQGEGDLAVVAYCRSDQAAVEDEVLHSVNDDGVAGNYPAQELNGRAAVRTAASPVNQECAMVSGDNATALAFGAFVEVWSQFTKANQPHFLTESGYHETSGPTAEIRLMSGRRTNIEPINKIHYEPNAGTDFKTASLFSLYRVPKRIIERVIVPVGGQATIIFANIPQNFEALMIHAYARSDVAAIVDNMAIEINNDVVNADYDRQYLQGSAAAVTAARSTGIRTWISTIGDTEGIGQFSGATLIFPAYSESDRHKHVINFEGRSEHFLSIRSLRWESNDPITRVEFTPNNGAVFLEGSVFELEGILRKEGLPPIEGMQWGV